MKKKKYKVCGACGHVMYYIKNRGWRCGPGCDKAVNTGRTA